MENNNLRGQLFDENMDRFAKVLVRLDKTLKSMEETDRKMSKIRF